MLYWFECKYCNFSEMLKLKTIIITTVFVNRKKFSFNCWCVPYATDVYKCIFLAFYINIQLENTLHVHNWWTIMRYFFVRTISKHFRNQMIIYANFDPHKDITSEYISNYPPVAIRLSRFTINTSQIHLRIPLVWISAEKRLKFHVGLRPIYTYFKWLHIFIQTNVDIELFLIVLSFSFLI